MKVLLLNAGSSSLKATLAESGDGKKIARGQADWAGSVTRYEYARSDGRERSEQVHWRGHAQAVQRFVFDLMHAEPTVLQEPGDLAAVGHRVVHGGEFTSSVRITPETRSRITALADLAPLHNPPSLETLAAAEAELPSVPQVAVFDTAFHATLPPEARTYPVPASWTRDWCIRRFGFHGLSHAYCSRRAAEMLTGGVLSPAQASPLASWGRGDGGEGLQPAGSPHPGPLPRGEREIRPDQLRLVICHLGHGCSASAVRGGCCIDTTMGFTPLEGLMMATRSGSIDPSIVLHVQQRHALTAAQIESALNRESGLLGVSGISGDMRQVLTAARGGHQQARLALEVYTHRVRQAIGALAVTMGGVDALVFTAGVGEHASEVRESICTGLGCLGLELDAQANASCVPDGDVARPSSPGRILVISTREDVTMLREVIQVLGGTR